MDSTARAITVAYALVMCHGSLCTKYDVVPKVTHNGHKCWPVDAQNSGCVAITFASFALDSVASAAVMACELGPKGPVPERRQLVTDVE